MAQHIFTGTTSPAFTPTAVGQHYIDTSAGISYISVGTTNSSDWSSTDSMGAAVWGLITGTLSNQTDLQSALNAKLTAASNLSDLANAATARTNLGLGTAATQNSSAFDAAGTASAAIVTHVAQPNPHTQYLLSASNLSDLANAGTARTNLGLGTAATANTSAFDPSGAAAAAQAFSIQRANQTGTQLASTISDFATVAQSSVLPTGGTTGQFLSKTSNTNYDVQWVTGSGGGGVSSLNSLTGALAIQAGTFMTVTPSGSDITLDVAITGNNNAFAGFDGTGDLQSIPGFQIDTTSGGMSLALTESPNNYIGGLNVHTINTSFTPLQNSPDEFWNIISHFTNLDSGSSGFTFGTNGNAINLINNNITHTGTGDVGGLAMLNNYFNLGNGTDPISVRGVSYSYGFGNVNANTTLNGPIQGYGFQISIDAAATLTNTAYISGFYDSCNISTPVESSYNSFQAGPTISSVANNSNYVSYNSNPNITTLTGNAGCFGLALSSTIGTINTGQYVGVNVNPTVTLNKNYVAGINVNMGNVTNYAGVVSSLVVQDITYTFVQPGDNNSYTIEYANTVLAGNETCTILGNAVTINIESGVSTATQVVAACTANLGFSGAVGVVITGTASNPQVTQAATNFTGGENPGRKLAADFTGDVNIQGALSFTGGLSIGALSSFANYSLTSGTGSPVSIDTLITAPTVAASATLTQADLLAVNTAMLLTIGDNASVSTNFLGLTALGLPAVLSMGTGSTVDRVGGAVFAISLDSGATGGVVNEVDLCRAIAIPNGTTTVNNLKGFLFDLPFGDPGTTTWGYYAALGHNYIGGDLKIGTGSDVADSGFAFHVAGDVKIENGSTTFIEATTVGLGFYAATPVAQQASSGPQTAGAVYTSTEQTMIQEMYNALRAYGLLT